MKRIPKLFYFKSKTVNKKDYIRISNNIADSCAVALNGLYRQMNPELKEIKEGDSYISQEIPYAYFRYDGKIWPVYDDDPGQQSYIYIDDKAYGAGSFTSYPYDVEYFCYEIDKYKGDK